MDASMGTGETSPGAPLSANGVDFSNATQAMDFLGAMLDDTDFQVVGNAFGRYFWYGLSTVIGLAGVVNLLQRTQCYIRLRTAAKNRPDAARPSNIVTKSIATITAVSREISYPQITPLRRLTWLRVPPLGTILLLLTYLGFVLGLEFINNDIPGAQHYTALGIRAGWLAVAQVPLLILLAGKNNLIGFVTGVSYERLNVLHRWASRMLLLLATLHFGYQNYGWAQYGLTQLEWSTDTCPPTGIAAYAILLWINLSTLAPLRNVSYEIFVIQHLLTFFGFIVAIMFHLPSTALYSRVYIYIPIGLYIVDRLVRTSRYVYNNAQPSRATLTAMDGGVTKIRLNSKQVKRWTPGSFVLLSIPRFGLGQSHPATIASVPSSHDNDLVFILKSHKGFTKRVMNSANDSATSLLPHHKEDVSTPIQETRVALIDGPYGDSHADFAAFDTVLLIAGSTGVTFTLSLLLDLAHRASLGPKLPLRRLEFIWIVKKTSWTSWISNELISASAQLKNAGIETSIKIYVTCDDAYTDESDDVKKCGCNCDKSLGPCCCTRIDEEGEQSSSLDVATSPSSDIKIEEAPEKQAPTSCCSKTKTTITKNSSRSSLATCATYNSGRPGFRSLLWDHLQEARGETGIAVCGPLGLSTEMRMTVASTSDERAVHKGTGAQGIYLHVETYSL